MAESKWEEFSRLSREQAEKAVDAVVDGLHRRELPDLRTRMEVDKTADRSNFRITLEDLDRMQVNIDRMRRKLEADEQ